MSTNPSEVYSLAKRLIEACRVDGNDAIAAQLDDALHAGSSALETLGAVRKALLDNEDVLSEFADPSEIDAAVAFVDKTFGRNPA